MQQAFFSYEIPNRRHWNQALRFTARQALDPARLGAALAALVATHDALRLRFELRDGTWTQRVVPLDPHADLLWVRPHGADADALCDRAQRSLDLQHGPLLRAVLLDETTLFVAIHHLAVDGVSWRVLLDDLTTAWRQLEAGQPAQQVHLAPPATSWAAWTASLARHAESGGHDGEMPYWRALAAATELAPPCLSCDVPTGSARVRDAERVVLAFDGETTARLLKQAPAAYRTQVNDLLLTALARALGRDGELLVELEGHGREALGGDADLSRTVGWFASHFPLRLCAGGALPDAIVTVKESLRALPNKGVGFGVLKTLGHPAIRAELAALPKPRVTFNYLGQFDRAEGDALLTPQFGASGAERDGNGPLTNRLAIHGQVAGGRLELVWVYSREQYRAATVEALADAFERELRSLIDHCCAAHATGCGRLTPSDVPLAGLDAATLARLPATDLADLYPATPMQQGMLFHALLEPEASVYVNQLRMTLTDPDVERLAAAWQEAIDAHAILRTGFWHETLETPQQMVFRQARLPFSTVDLCGDADQDARLAEIAEAERARPFDLAAPPLMRVVLVRLTDCCWRMIWTRHHLLLDGWSTARLWAEVLRRYAGEAVAPPLARYRDYIARLAGEDRTAQRTFWQQRLAALDEPALLAGAIDGGVRETSAMVDTTGHGRIKRRLSADASVALRDFARAQHVTVNTLIQGAWALLLQRHTGRHVVAFGATVAGRPAELAGIDEVLGLFINTLPVRVRTDEVGVVDAVSAMRDQLAVSSASWRRPARVRW